jgi:hypothetical protein
MAKQRKAWVFSAGGKTKATLSGTFKDEVDIKCRKLVDEVLKPRHIKPPSAGYELNYITEISVRWIGSACYFISIYTCPGANAISPTFEAKFARMEYVGDAKFTLSFMRHNGKWVALFSGISVDECIKAITDDPWFQP